VTSRKRFCLFPFQSSMKKLGIRISEPKDPVDGICVQSLNPLADRAPAKFSSASRVKITALIAILRSENQWLSGQIIRIALMRNGGEPCRVISSLVSTHRGSRFGIADRTSATVVPEPVFRLLLSYREPTHSANKSTRQVLRHGVGPRADRSRSGSKCSRSTR